jgi:hypothetical protein
MKRRAVVLAFLAAPIAWACTSHPSTPDADAGSCPNGLPTCPSTPPSYVNDVAPIIAKNCLACHGDGGSEVTSHDLRTYESLYPQRSAILDQVYACTMPPADAGPLPDDERLTLLTWLECRAPEN